jgi:hypothetical protein
MGKEEWKEGSKERGERRWKTGWMNGRKETEKKLRCRLTLYNFSLEYLSN